MRGVAAARAHRARTPIAGADAYASAVAASLAQARRLLPLAAVPDQRDEGSPIRIVFRAEPRVHLPPVRLFEELVLEHVAAQPTPALLHRHAAENVSRLVATPAAKDNVARMFDGLRADASRLRQEAITAEIVEPAAGLRALRGAQDDASDPGSPG